MAIIWLVWATTWLVCASVAHVADVWASSSNGVGVSTGGQHAASPPIAALAQGVWPSAGGAPEVGDGTLAGDAVCGVAASHLERTFKCSVAHYMFTRSPGDIFRETRLLKRSGEPGKIDTKGYVQPRNL